MLNRLRQRESLSGGNFLFTTVPHFSWITPTSWTRHLDLARGCKQMIYDEQKALLKNERLILARQRLGRTKNSPPPIGPLFATKVRYVLPVQQVSGRLNQFDQDILMSSDCLAATPFSHPSFGNWRPADKLEFTSVDQKLASWLYQKTLSRMSSAEYDFGPSVGEVAETAAMLAGPLRSIATLSSAALAGISFIRSEGANTAFRLAKNATSKQIKRLKTASIEHPLDTSLRIADESANHWLAYKFGVCPFLDDVGKIIDFAKDGLSPMFGLRHTKVKSVKLIENTNGLRTNDYINDIRFNTMITCVTQDRHYFGMYWRNQMDAPLVNFLENIGLSPFQLPSLTYELIPLSFVVDRFIDIKSFVRGNLGSLTKNQLAHYCTRKISTAYAYTMYNCRYGDNRDSYSLNVDKPLRSNIYMDQIARSVNLERPKFPVVNPQWRKELEASATNMALIWGRLRTHVGKLL